jgi:FKBP-type peptidyl-prolyl cis-trans isomerase FkpA
MIIVRTSIFLCSLALVVACIDPIKAPPCNTTELTQTSVIGDTISLSSGLRYLNGVAGSGALTEWCEAVAVHYTEYLADGTRLNSTHDLEQPLVFTPGVGDLVEGFEQGVVGMRTGGVRRLIVPPSLAYGSVAQRNSAGEIVIPANSTLIYDIEVVATAQ